MHNPLVILAGHAASWRGRVLSQDIEHHARRALVDWFSALLAGCTQAPATLLGSALAEERGIGRAISYADGQPGPLRRAALMNATASHAAEFDDIHRDSGYHPGAPVIGAALAAAQARGRTMEELLRAIIAGYEVSCRIGMAVQPSHYRFWHTTGTVGTFGAATAVAFLLRCGAQQIAHALATAGTFASGLQQAFRGDGMSKPLHAGHAADAGALAALGASAGVTGALDVLHGPVGFAAATSEDAGKWDRALAGLGEDPLITNITFKNHGCCGHIFAGLDALAELKAQHGFSRADVVSIHLGGYGPTKDVCDRPVVHTAQEARFSAQYCFGALLVQGGVRLAAFEPAALADPRIREEMAKVTVSLDPELAGAYPSRRAANVTVKLHDGTTLFHHQPTRKGDPDAPLTDEDLSAKFRELTVPVIGAAAAECLLDALWHGREVPGALPLRIQEKEG